MKKRIIQRAVSGQPLPEGLPEILRHVYARRDSEAASAWQQTTQALKPEQALKGIDAACQRLALAMAEHQKILIVGDFDADGATSTALAIRSLRKLGCQQVEYLVPDRFRFGYGLSPELVAVAHAQFNPALIMTVDNGISSHAGIDKANALGIDVVVTDHHLSGETLPAACAIVNPNQPGDTFPSKHIAGVGVCWYVMVHLRTLLRQQGWFSQQGIAEPNMADQLDLVALGTVADVVRLDRINRILVNQGLARIRHGRCNEGIKALITVAGRNQGHLQSSDLGFALGPRLNAAGRLENMGQGIACLLSDDPAEALQLASDLDMLNQQRREIEGEMQEQAERYLADIPRTDHASGLALFNDEWHQGVIGILASRIKEQLHRPVIAFALAGDDHPDMLKGSGRSIKGLNIRDVLASIDRQQPALIHQFGGHAMAAGLSLARKDFETFRLAFAHEVSIQLGNTPLEAIIESDGPLPAEQHQLACARLLHLGGPWGQGFPEPLFDGLFILHEKRLVGRKHLKLRVSPHNGQQIIDAIAFNTREEDCPEIGANVHLAYRLDINRFRGQESLQLIIEQIEAPEKAPAIVLSTEITA